MKLEHIDQGKAFDWGRASTDYARYRDIYPEAFYSNIVEMGLCTAGQKVLDLGTGTGVLPRNLYRYGAKFVGSDIAENQIVQARRLSAGMEIEYVVSPAEEVDFPDGTFDVVLACQCFMYFNREKLLPNLHRMLKPGGHFCILAMAWLSAESDIASGSERLVLKYNPAWSGGNNSRQKFDRDPAWLGGLFKVDVAKTFDLPVHFTRESWHGRIKACRGIGASSLTADQIADWEQEHQCYLASQPEEFDISHEVIVYNLVKI